MRKATCPVLTVTTEFAARSSNDNLNQPYQAHA
jgi:hypothetical protein